MNSNFTLSAKMKRNLLLGITLIGAMALSSCSVNKTASTQNDNDDVYFSKAKAAEAPEYVAKPVYRQEVEEEQYSDDDDYYYYDDYSSRINRFAYASPFNYYDSYYGAYSPYNYYNYGGIGLGFSPYNYYGSYGYGGGFYGGIGFGYGAFSPYGGFGYGYGGYGGYGYSSWGIGYGGSPYWGVYSAYNSYRGTPRPNRGNGNPRGGGRTGIGYTGVANNGIGYYPNRPNRGANSSGTVRTYGNGTYRNANGGYTSTRPTRAARGDNGSTYQPQQRPATVERQPSYSPPPSNSGGGGGGNSGGGGGGGRPTRP